MRIVPLIFLVLYLLQPIACFAHPCDSWLDRPDATDTTGESGDHAPHNDSDSCETTICCADCIILNIDFSINYSPLVSKLATPERYQKLLAVDLPIFVPPQSIS